MGRTRPLPSDFIAVGAQLPTGKPSLSSKHEDRSYSAVGGKRPEIIQKEIDDAIRGDAWGKRCLVTHDATPQWQADKVKRIKPPFFVEQALF